MCKKVLESRFSEVVARRSYFSDTMASNVQTTFSSLEQVIYLLTYTKIIAGTRAKIRLVPSIVSAVHSREQLSFSTSHLEKLGRAA